MSWLNVGKTLFGGIVSIGVGNIVGNIVKATTPANLNTFNKLSIQVGTFVLSGMVAAQAVTYVNNEVDSIVTQVAQKKSEREQKSQD